MKRIADIVVETLIKKKIKICFSVVGGGAMHLNNAFVINSKIKKLYNHHEQACAMAAESYARASGNMAAVCVTSGPGGTNAINGVQGAWVDSIPMIVISGYPRMNASKKGTNLDIRCCGVQENDIIAQVKSITKYAKFIDDPKSIKHEIEYAIDVALEGRRGPVWIDIPLDIQGMKIEESELYPYRGIEKRSNQNELKQEIKSLFGELKKAKRPCILTGSGIRSGNAIEEFRKFIEIVKIPIVGGCILPDICYNGQERYYGMSGNVGPRTGNFILQNADYILVLGNSLAYKQTGFNREEFAPNAKIVMVDAQEDEAKKTGLHVNKCINADLKDFFKSAIDNFEEIKGESEWVKYCDNIKEKFPSYEMLTYQKELTTKERVPALLWWKEIMKIAKKDAIFALGNSSCIYGILQEGVSYKEQRVLVNYNCGSMGHDLPNSIGAAAAFEKEVLCVTGDGSIMMNLQELQTIRYNKLPIKIVIFSNDGYGAIRNTCTNFFNGTYTGCDEESGVSFPSFEKVANAFDFPYMCCNCIDEIVSTFEWLQNQESFCILEVKERINEISGPKLTSKMLDDGSFITPALHEMSPFLSEEELENCMFHENIEK